MSERVREREMACTDNIQIFGRGFFIITIRPSFLILFRPYVRPLVRSFVRPKSRSHAKALEKERTGPTSHS